jgi:chromodomain-helicase-DNA-binding protein 4
MISESSETEKSTDDDSESLSDEETIGDSDQMISDGSNESRIATRSKRRVNRINYSDEKYFRSRLGNDPDDLKRKKKSSNNDSDKKRFKILTSINGKNGRSTNQNKKISRFNSFNKKSRYHQESGDDDDDNNDDNNNDDSETDKFSGNSDSMEGSSNQDSEDDDSESDSSKDRSKSIIDPISAARANNPQFISAHLDWCKKCGGAANRHSSDKGPLVLCEYCSNSFHSICYSRKTTNSKIICQQCNKIDSHVSRCMICHEESYNKENDNSKSKGDSKKSNKVSTSNLDPDDSQVFFRCLYCTQAAHESCLPFLNEEKTLKDKMISYRESWKCHLCLKWEDKVDKILTYRKVPADKNMETSEPQDTPTPQSEDINSDSDNIEDYEFLVKFKDLSYLQVEWVPGPWLYGVTPNKYNVYIKSQPEQLTKEEVIQEDWTKIHRILDVQFKSEVTLRDQLTKGQKNLGRGAPVQAYVKWKGLNYFDGKY